MVYIIIIILHKERKKIGSAIWIIFISLSRYCFWLHKVSEDRILRRLKMKMIIVITERSGASESWRLPGLLQGEVSLKTEGE